jgi:hypothetical protein
MRWALSALATSGAEPGDTGGVWAANVVGKRRHDERRRQPTLNVMGILGEAQQE